MSGEGLGRGLPTAADLIETHQTTLVFVNTRRMAERVTSTWASCSARKRSHHTTGAFRRNCVLAAEDRLKRGELKALVATASLELGIRYRFSGPGLPIGINPLDFEIPCNVLAAQSTSARGCRKAACFRSAGMKLVESAALLRSIRHGELDCLHIPEKPLDVLAQQIVAAVASEDWDERRTFQPCARSWPYRNLARKEFDDVVQMLASGFSTKRGRRAALIHYDAVNRKLRSRRGSRLLALTSGGAISRQRRLPGHAGTIRNIYRHGE